MTTQPVSITVAHGDGIGKEIMTATLRILEAAGAQIHKEEIIIGEQLYLAGNTSGIAPASWESLRRTKVLLKGPITTPQGGGYKSINVTIRKVLGLYANIRPCVSYHPFVATKHPVMDVVIVRENEEDLYAGVEHQQTDEVVQCLKLISRPGCEKIIRFAFEYARAYNRKKVTCFSKDNIMKMTDGLFHRIYDEIGAEYPEIQKEHFIVDIGAARLADTPEIFDVIVMENLYGDILSDIAAQITGSVGLAGSANIGDAVAMFEAIHGSAPDIAGKDIANPSGLLQAAVQMLVHIGQAEIGNTIQNAWLRTIEDGIHTTDIYKAGTSKERVGTAAFADAVIARLGLSPVSFPVANFSPSAKMGEIHLKEHAPKEKLLVGVDIFIHFPIRDAEALASIVKKGNDASLELQMITNRGVKVWPNGFPETFCTDHWRCRFKTAITTGISYQTVIDLMQRLHNLKLDVIKSENLYLLDGVQAFSAAQGQ